MRYFFMTLLAGLWLLMGCSKTSRDNSGSFLIHFSVPPSEKDLEFAVDQGRLEPLTDDSFGRRFAADKVAKELIVRRKGEEFQRLALRQDGNEAWFFAGSNKAYSSAPPVLPQNEKDLVVYFVPDSDQAQAGWGLHIWDGVNGRPFTAWETPFPFALEDPIYGRAARLDLPPQKDYSAAPAGYSEMPDKLGLLVHRGDDKATGDVFYEPSKDGRIVFVAQKGGKVFCSPDLKPCGSQIETSEAAGHWVSRNELLVKITESATRYMLLSSADASIDIAKLETLPVDAIKQIPLEKNAGISKAASQRFPHLKTFMSFSLNADEELAALAKSQLVVVALNANSRVLAATRVQLGGLLDDVFATAQDTELGLVIGLPSTLRLWAPTAQAVQLKVYGRDKTLLETRPMLEENRVWSTEIPATWVSQRLYYRYAIKVFHPISGRIEQYEVSDPYAVSGSMNGEFSQFIDLNAPELKPAGWDTTNPTLIEKPTDMVFYELHIRDFSSADKSVPAELRGTYKAFTQNGKRGQPLSNGMAHLQRLQKAGLTHIQVLPAYDFGTVEENRDKRIDLDDPFSSLCTGFDLKDEICTQSGTRTIFDIFTGLPPDSEKIAELNSLFKDRDSFNWGYDPVHYGMPEGGYASTADGEARVIEFREMVQSLGELNLHFAMDVVYNHTQASGLNNDSILDKVVPGYFHRLDPYTGRVYTTTCCQNTASERLMMEKLMIDTLKRWHEDYKVQAFRFDLMGYHFKQNMQKIQEALGADVFIFGEGWKMGEVNDDERANSTATQLNLGGTGIGTFNDRFRDTVRGSGPLVCGVRHLQQGPLNGLFFDDNGRGGKLEEAKKDASCANRADWKDVPDERKKDELLHQQDRLRAVLAASLSDYPVLTSSGAMLKGSELSFFQGVPLSYTKAPRETLNYIENHDNQTFWDITQLKLPYTLKMEERVRVQAVGLSLNMLAVGVPYFHMGAEFLRSKSLIRDSYNAGDWYNQVDFTFSKTNWNRGLPPAENPADKDNMPVIRDAIQALPEGPAATDIQKAVGMFVDLLALRKDSPLFRLHSADDVIKRVSFVKGSEKMEGIIAMRLSDEGEGVEDLDPCFREIVVIFNMNKKVQTLPYPAGLSLHPLQLRGHDEVVKQSKSDGGMIEVPARTTAVFVRRQTMGAAMCPVERLNPAS